MKKFSLKTLTVASLVLLLTGFAFAHGMGYGGYGMMNGGYHHMGSGYGNGYGMMNGYGHMGGWNNLSAEDQKKMGQEMDKYLAATRDLRSAYYQKQLDLEQAYAAPEKDQAKIDGIEKELFDLSSQLEKKRFDHMTAMRDLFGDKARGFSGNGGCF